jgi:putative DNA primase/helicase
MAKHESEIRQLRAVIEHGFVLEDGSVCDKPGYDQQTELFLWKPPGVELQQNPTKEDAARAAQELLDPVCDVPFASALDRSVFLAAVLTLLCRWELVTVPMILIDKSVRGAGGSLLADVLGTLVTGRTIPRLPQGANDEELRKQLTSLMVAGDAIVLIDNVSRPLGGAPLDAMLTAPVWQDRLLGTNDMISVPNVATFIATGNNVSVLGDTVRRTLRLRIEPIQERPEERNDFRHPNLLAHVREQRPRLLAAAMTILSAYRLAGSPPAAGVWGSFEEWSAKVAGAVVFCGLPDPTEARLSHDSLEEADHGDLLDILRGLRQLDSEGTGLPAREILSRFSTSFSPSALRLREILSPPGGQPLTAKMVGTRLHKHLGRVVAGMKLECQSDRAKNCKVWRVVSEAGKALPAVSPVNTPGAEESQVPAGGDENAIRFTTDYDWLQ